MAKSLNDQSSTVILARVSSKAQEDEGYSLDAQLKLLKGYCDSKGLRVVRIFKIAETASKEQSRKVFHEMLAYIETEAIYHLAVEKTDRFTRNFRDAVAIDEWLGKDENRRLHAVKENLLLHKNAKSDVKFMWNIHISVAKKYADNLREESMKGWAEKLAQGWKPSPPPPGYMTVTQNSKRIHVPNPETQGTMLQIFKKYLEPGESILTMVEEMKRLGIKTRGGRYYGKSHMQNILTDPFYIGINKFNGKTYPGAQERIIPEELFESVQQKMHRGRPRKFAKHNSPLQGLIRCQDCGSVITWQLQKGRYYGVCRRLTTECKQNKMLRQDYVEEQVMAELKKLICPSPAIIDWVVSSMRAQHKDSIEQRERLAGSLEAQIKRVSTMDDNMYEDKLSGEITKERYEVKHERFLSEKAEYQTQLNKLDTILSSRLEQRLGILELSQKAAEIYASKPPEQKRLIISKLFANLTLRNGELSVTYSKFVLAIAERVQKTRILMEG
jgi:site-specific DNA recombinase